MAEECGERHEKRLIKAQDATGLNPYPKTNNGCQRHAPVGTRYEPPWYLEIGVSPQTAQSSAILGPGDAAALKKLPSVAVGDQRMTLAQARAHGQVTRIQAQRPVRTCTAQVPRRTKQMTSRSARKEPSLSISFSRPDPGNYQAFSPP